MKYIHISIFAIVFFWGSTAWSQSDKKPNAFKSNAITFYYGTGSDMSQQQISDQLDEQLKYDYPNKANNTIQAPQIIGYQYHIKERLSIGLVYCISNVETPTLEYPDFQNPGEVTKYTYRVGLNSFLGSVDWHWYVRNGNKSTLALNSGIALGVFNVNFETNILSGDASNLPQINLSQGGSGWQVTLIGIKQAFHYQYLKGFGYHASLGLGVNTIGLTTGINYTL
jgi:hypothetical protein